MLEAGVEMGLFAQCADAAEVGVVYVGIYSEEPLEYSLDDLKKIGWEGVLVSLWEEAGVIYLHSIDTRWLQQPATCQRLPTLCLLEAAEKLLI